MYYIERWCKLCSCHCIDSLVLCNFTLSPQYPANNPVRNSLSLPNITAQMILSRSRAASRWSNSHPLQKLRDHSPSLSVSISTTLWKYRCAFEQTPTASDCISQCFFMNSFCFHHVVCQTEIWCRTHVSPRSIWFSGGSCRRTFALLTSFIPARCYIKDQSLKVRVPYKHNIEQNTTWYIFRKKTKKPKISVLFNMKSLNKSF